jgi:urea transporter
MRLWQRANFDTHRTDRTRRMSDQPEDEVGMPVQPEDEEDISAMPGNAGWQTFLRGDMEAWTSFLETRCATERGWHAVRFADAVLRGFSQVYLMSNSVTGLLMALALLLSSSWYHLRFAFLGGLGGTVGGLWAHGGGHPDVWQGHYGYDGVLTGAAVATLAVPSWGAAAACASLGVACGVARKTMGRLCDAAGVPAFTMTFNVVTLTLFTVVRKDRMFGMALQTGALPTTARLDYALWLGVSQLTFVDTVWGAILVLAALAWCHGLAVGSCIAGAVMGAGAAAAMGAAGLSGQEWEALMTKVKFGLYGYNAAACVVVAMFCCGSQTLRWRVTAALGAAPASTVAAMVLESIMSPLPVLTMPFVLVAWGIMLSQEKESELQLPALTAQDNADGEVVTGGARDDDDDMMLRSIDSNGDSVVVTAPRTSIITVATAQNLDHFQMQLRTATATPADASLQPPPRHTLAPPRQHRGGGGGRGMIHVTSTETNIDQYDDNDALVR